MPGELRSRVPLLLRVLSVAVLVALVVFVAERLDWHEVGRALARAYWPLVLAAASVNFLNVAAKSARWRTLLLDRVGFLRLYWYLIVAYAASAVLPARAGEALRVYLLRRRDGIPVADSVSVVIVEKLFEVLGLLVVVLPLPLFLPLPTSVRASIWAVAAGGLVALAIVVVLARTVGRDPGSRLSKLASALASMRSPSTIALATFYSVLAYVLDGAMVWLCLRALHIEVPWATPALVLLGGNLAIAIPITPGQLGALEAGVIAALSIVGVPFADALAFGVVYHIMQLVPIVLVGMSGLGLVSEAKAEGDTPAEPVAEVVS